MKYYKYLVYNYTIKTNYPCKYLHPLKTEALDTQKEILIEINDFKCDYFPNLNPSKGNFIYKINFKT